jgi:hypothetical protein
MIIKGHPYSHIATRIPGKDGKPIDRRSISTHAKEHMDFQDAALRAILEEEANLVGQNYEEGVKGAITHRGVLEVAIRKAYDDILNDVSTVEPRDLIQMVKLLNEMNSNQFDVGLDELRTQVALFVQAIKDEADLETQARIAARVKELRQRDNIDAAFEESMKEPKQIPEAVVVEDEDESNTST